MTETKTKQKAKIYTWEKLMQEPDEIDWIVKDLFSFGSVVTISGEPGSKKTWAMLDLLICIVSHKDNWLGFEIVKSVPALIVDEESGHRRLGMRLKKVARGHKIHTSLEITTTCISGFNLRDMNDIKELNILMKQTNAKVVLIDTLMDVLAGGDDNAAKDVNPLYKNLRKLADIHHALIIVIHHNNKNGGYRGSSAIKGSSDLMIKVESKQNSPNIDFKTEKTRDIEETKWAAYIHSNDNEFRLRKSGVSISKIGKVQEHVISILQSQERMSIVDIEKNNGEYSTSSIKGAVYKLIELGYVAQSGFSDRKKYYTLTDDGISYADTFLPVDVSMLINAL